MTDQLRPSWSDHAPLPWSVDDADPKCVRDARWTVLVDLMTGNDEADAQLARLIADAGNGAAESRAASAEAEVERLTRLLKEATVIAECRVSAASDAEYWADHAKAAEASASALRDRVAVLESALKPFVAHYAGWMDDWDASVPCNSFAKVTFGQLRAARAALNGGDHGA